MGIDGDSDIEMMMVVVVVVVVVVGGWVYVDYVRDGRAE